MIASGKRGRVVAAGRPAVVARAAESRTAPYLARVVGLREDRDASWNAGYVGQLMDEQGGLAR